MVAVAVVAVAVVAVVAVRWRQFSRNSSVAVLAQSPSFFQVFCLRGSMQIDAALGVDEEEEESTLHLAPVEETEPAPAFTAIMTDRPCNSVVRRDPSGQFFIELVPCSSDSESEDDEGPPDHGPLAPASAPSPTSAPPPTSSFCTPAKKAVMDVNVSETPAKKAKRDGGEEPSGSEEKNQADGGEELSGSKQKPLARFEQQDLEEEAEQ